MGKALANRHRCRPYVVPMKGFSFTEEDIAALFDDKDFPVWGKGMKIFLKKSLYSILRLN